MTPGFKLDENIDPRWGKPLEEAGCVVRTVAEQSLQGAADSAVAKACIEEQFCLVTADQDFAQILDYPPQDYRGLIILRHSRPSLGGMQTLIRQVVVALQSESPNGKLWIVEPGRIRIHENPE